MEDGLLCRSDQDCMWLDERLRCTDYKMDWSVASDWFNGDTASIVGSCDCLEGFWYEESQISCIVSVLSCSAITLCSQNVNIFVSGVFEFERRCYFLYCYICYCWSLHPLCFLCLPPKIIQEVEFNVLPTCYIC